ncbi:hypothetical protein IC575_006321 [Cucumis melo]
MCRRWLADEHLDALFLFIRLKIKAVGIPSSQNFTTADAIFMVWNRHCILVSKWPLHKECIKENRPFDWDEEYRLVDYVVGSKEDFQDPWASVDYVYSPFNVHGNHWVLLCLDLVSCQVKVWDSLPSLSTTEEMTNILLLIRQLVPKLLDSTGFFDRRGRSSTYKEPWPVVIVDSIPLQRNNSDCGVFTIMYFEYIAAGVGLDTLCQENMSYFRKQLAFLLELVLLEKIKYKILFPKYFLNLFLSYSYCTLFILPLYLLFLFIRKIIKTKVSWFFSRFSGFHVSLGLLLIAFNNFNYGPTLLCIEIFT